MKLEQVISWIKSQADPIAVKGQARFAITSKNNFGVSFYKLRPYSKKIGKDHDLAIKLWNTNIHDARLLATMIDEPEKVSENQMEEWVKEFNSWDICDQCCCNLFDKTSYAYQKAFEWSEREEEFIKRAGFVLMAGLSVHDNKASDKDFELFFSIIIRESDDDRNFVKKAVNWALRQIGKRNKELNKMAIDVAMTILKSDYKTAKWIAKDAIKELTSERLLKKFLNKKKARRFHK